MLAVPSRADVRERPLDTPRLTLAPLDASDAAELWLAVDADRPFLEQWLPWVPFVLDREATYRYCEACAADWDGARACRMSIRTKTKDRRLIGVIGLEGLGHLHRNSELGYWLRSDSCGQGYMTEAGFAVVRWAFDRIKVHRVRAAAAIDNLPSLKVIQRLGFKYEGVARQAEYCKSRWLDHATFGLLETDHSET